jgi:hypothetical protein
MLRRVGRGGWGPEPAARGRMKAARGDGPRRLHIPASEDNDVAFLSEKEASSKVCQSNICRAGGSPSPPPLTHRVRFDQRHA